MKERPILFSAPMVRAILDGRKTVTRRVITPQPPFGIRMRSWDGEIEPELSDGDGGTLDAPLVCRQGGPGDQLWVKETWQYADWTEDGYPFIRYRGDGASLLRETGLPESLHEDVWSVLSLPKNYNIDGKAADRKWRPSIYMPRWASRILLEVVSVRVERLHEITEEESILEGVEPDRAHGLGHPDDADSARERYRALWDAINSGRGYGWNVNPWVWRVEFSVLSR